MTRNTSRASTLLLLTGGGVDEKITLRIAAADGEDELLGRDVAIKGVDLQDAHAGGRVLRHGGIVNWELGQRRIIVLVQHLHVNLNMKGSAALIDSLDQQVDLFATENKNGILIAISIRG